jgi:hypothetical protein
MKHVEYLIAKEGYVKSNGTICPYCGSDDLYSSHEDYAFHEDRKYYHEMSCRSCKKRWYSIYQLTGFLPYEEQDS